MKKYVVQVSYRIGDDAETVNADRMLKRVAGATFDGSGVYLVTRHRDVSWRRKSISGCRVLMGRLIDAIQRVQKKTPGFFQTWEVSLISNEGLNDAAPKRKPRAKR